MMPVGLHMRLIGHPVHAVGLERLLDYRGRQHGVWITRRIDIARHWLATHPLLTRRRDERLLLGQLYRFEGERSREENINALTS